MNRKIVITLIFLIIILIAFFLLHRNKKNCEEKVYYLSSKDFECGPYEIKNCGTYILTEDIIFNPNPDYDHLPRPYQLEKEKHKGPHCLGFHTCISVQASNVVIDLNHYSINMSKAFYFKQRFYSHIELNGTPFIPPQGPGDFGKNIKEGINIEIKNGTLGLTSHHCIHGNENGNVKISNVKFENYEIAAIGINNPDKLIIENCYFGSNFQKVPVSAAFSSARQLINLSKILYEETHNEELYQKIQDLECLTNEAFDQYMESGKVYVDLFKNEQMLPDGGVYYIVIHSKGVSVDDFQTAPEHKVDEVIIRDCKFEGLKTKINEVVGIKHKDNDMIKTSVDGSVFKILDWCDRKLRYVKNPLAELQFCVAKLKPDFAKNTICGDIINWAKHRKKITWLLSKGYEFIIHSDSMFHVIKGLNCIRIDAVKKVTIENVKIHNFENYSEPSYDYIVDKKYTKIHPKQVLNDHYLGTRCCGIILTSVDEIYIKNVCVHNGYSEYGESIAILTQNCLDYEEENLKIEGVDIDYVKV